jgi:flagellar basal body-associated protein FliL
MAEGESESAVPERTRKKTGTRKLLVTIIPLVLIAVVAAKLTILKPPPPTPAEASARAAVAQYELDTKCALANGMTPPRAPGDGTASSGATPTTVKSPDATGPTLDLDATTLNLAGGHFLKVGVSLQLPAKAVADDVKVNENWASIVSQLVLDTFSGRSLAELAKDGTREKLQHEIGYRTCERTGGKVTTVYFVDFVMQ